MDYFVFVTMLVACAVIGFYYGFIEKKGKRKSPDRRRGSEALDYLVGGRQMKVFPVSLSVVSSFVSGISLLGPPTEIYVYETQYAFILVTIGFSAVISWYIFLPVFYNLQLTSTYEVSLHCTQLVLYMCMQVNFKQMLFFSDKISCLYK
ncbi:sodium-coupled monocarboxylate transporter 1-like [Eupeodes corollae]|uniref:sodium-coupled monocarboxylate transporter 1-like n=1 Tax=Eupeodes corollae TaxID=290404 RepID=UPI002493A4AF|nr:sodium-coupled monocarboxylate transporter 1-like [Eupeodes corollae]